MNSELLTMATKWIDNCFLTPSQLRRSYQGDSVKWKTDTCKELQWNLPTQAPGNIRIISFQQKCFFAKRTKNTRKAVKKE